MKKDTPCPCGSGESYRACCGPRHAGTQPAQTPEQLMRSRYSAFALGNANYLVATRHPDFRAGDDLKSIQASLRGLRWKGLEIVAASGGPGDTEGTVEFRAHYLVNLTPQLMHERSQFRCENGRWYYCDGDVNPA